MQLLSKLRQILSRPSIIGEIDEDGWRCINAPSPIEDLRPFATENRFGKWRVQTHGHAVYCTDLLALCTAVNDIFERQIYDFVTPSISPYIIDGGAHIGMFSLRAKQLYPDAHVVAFEPDQEARELFEKNIQANGLGNIRVVPAGLLDIDGEMDFFSCGTDGNTLFAQDKANAKVAVTRLSPYLERQTDFIKLNIEGGELPVLRECQGVLGNVRAITLEYHVFPELGDRLHSILEILNTAKFHYDVQHYSGELRKPNLAVDRKNYLCVAAQKWDTLR